MDDIRIGSWVISYNPKPIPDRRHDYDALYDDYDGTNGLYFTAGSVKDAKEMIVDMENNVD